jgi:hypothetical protein
MKAFGGVDLWAHVLLTLVPFIIAILERMWLNYSRDQTEYASPSPHLNKSTDSETSVFSLFIIADGGPSPETQRFRETSETPGRISRRFRGSAPYRWSQGVAPKHRQHLLDHTASHVFALKPQTSGIRISMHAVHWIWTKAYVRWQLFRTRQHWTRCVLERGLVQISSVALTIFSAKLTSFTGCRDIPRCRGRGTWGS